MWGEVVSSHSISGKEMLANLDEQTVPVMIGKGVAKAHSINIGEATISTPAKRIHYFRNRPEAIRTRECGQKVLLQNRAEVRFSLTTRHWPVLALTSVRALERKV